MSASATVPNADQRAAWDGDEGAHWTEHAERYEASTAAHRARLWAAVPVAVDADVLDIGCGTGEATLHAARHAPEGQSLGVDLSAAMLARARERADDEGLTNVTFLQADAQTHEFTDASVDLVVSCFVAMFFDDKDAAFANLVRTLRPGGRLAAMTWQGLDDNEWLQCIRGALSAGRDLPTPPPGGPGPFGLSEPDMIESTLVGAGFHDIELTSIEEPIHFGSDADDAFAFMKDQGVTRGMLGDLDATDAAAALDALHTTLADHETADGVTFRSAVWLIQATR